MNVLYICTHNRCRSALSEAITNQLGGSSKKSLNNESEKSSGQSRLIAKSAGSAPSGQVHPLTLKYLDEAGYSIKGLTSNSWEDQEYMGDFVPDIVITVCDNAAGEACPLWLGDIPKLHKLHWGLTDPSKDTEDEAITAENFRKTIHQIEQRVAELIKIAALPDSERLAALNALANPINKQ